MKDQEVSTGEPAKLEFLPAAAFEYLERVDPSVVTEILDRLACAGEIGSLHEGINAGLAGTDDLDRAVERIGAVLNVVASGESESLDLIPIEPREAVAATWITIAVQKHGDNLVEQACEAVDRLPPQSRVPRFRLLAQPRFSEYPHRLRAAHTNRWRFGRGEAQVKITAVGEQVSRGYLTVALSMCPPKLSHFPMTIALFDENNVQVNSLSLLEQYVMEWRQSSSSWNEISSAIETDSHAWIEIGMCALSLANAMAHEGEPTNPYEAMAQYHRASPAVCLFAVTSMIGIGAAFDDTEAAWSQLIDARVIVPVEGSQPKPLPLWAPFGIIDSSSGNCEHFLASLRRFFVEGNLSPNAQFEGRTVLQMAASEGLMPEIELLLELGADPSLCGDQDPSPPMTLARDNGHEKAAVMLHSATARNVMRRASRGAAT